MLDRYLHPRLKPALNATAALLDRPAVSPDGLTLLGFAIGVLALPFLALGWYQAALAAIVLNRLLDGLDGALARRRGLTDAGGFLDISLDFLFYALVPFGFILADPASNALAGGWLLFAFIGTGSSFLAFAALCWLTTFTRVWSGYLTLKQVKE
ncbi:CDP-alcohol phosphatidyltransferase family protein [Klebsiella oxytoca]|uniref:CDP-alcohol phosphatidyltransferase family protein n=1 Tax=Klebsiella oxytoca TaxID=571 RepID=UPI001CCCFD2F|nr:CDP-alcohol phosphatidyltransferase family protein [Klebsiella oxytoca]